jgi:pyridoxine 4-dehydrogenase
VDKVDLGGYAVGRIGFGAMQLPGPGVLGPPRDRDEALGVLRLALELGVDHIDTAQFYGPDVANELIREALHPYPDDLAIVSKVGARRGTGGAWLPAQEPAELRADIEANLRALDTDRLAVVNLRLMDDNSSDDSKPGVLKPDEFQQQLAVMVDARDQGLIAGIGLSNITIDHLTFALEHTEIACVQNVFSLADRSSQSVLDECISRGIAFVPFFPLGSGFSADNPVLGNAAVRRAAAREGITAAQIALAWTLAVAPKVLLIPGTSSIRHLEENMAVRDITLDDSTLGALGDAVLHATER